MIIMIKQKVTILLTGLICFSSFSGLFTVVCHGFDGHVAVEAVGHDHCGCSEAGGNGNQREVLGAGVGLSTGHGHCRDTVAVSNFIVPAGKNIKLSPVKAFTVNHFLNSISTQATSFFGYRAAGSGEFSSFFEPLRTIILLA